MGSISVASDWVKAGLLKGRYFVAIPSHINHLKDNRLDVDAIQDALESGQTKTRPISHYKVPKKRSGARRVPLIDIHDDVTVCAAIVENHASFYQAFEWTRALSLPIDHHEPMRVDSHNTDWIENFREAYNGFVTRTRADTASGHYVLNMDIQNFSPSIDIDILAGLISRLDLQNENAARLMLSMFSQWQNQGVNGIASGQVFTDPMMKLYLNAVDTKLYDLFGERYYRYVDDIRIVMDRPDEQDGVLVTVSGVLKEFNLHLGPDKTRLTPPSQLYAYEAEAIEPQSLLKAYKARFRPVIMGGNVQRMGPDFLPQMKEIIYGLGNANDASLVPDIAMLVTRYPACGKYMMNYLQRVGRTDAALPFLNAFLQKPGNGSFQHYFIYRRALEMTLQHGQLDTQSLARCADKGGYTPYQSVVNRDCASLALK